jgi:hypothetical protein
MFFKQTPERERECQRVRDKQKIRNSNLKKKAKNHPAQIIFHFCFVCLLPLKRIR